MAVGLENFSKDTRHVIGGDMQFVFDLFQTVDNAIIHSALAMAARYGFHIVLFVNTVDRPVSMQCSTNGYVNQTSILHYAVEGSTVRLTILYST